MLKASYGHYYAKPLVLIDGIDNFGDKTTQYFNGTDWETVSGCLE